MITFLATIHVIACIALIIVAMMQDSKGGGMFSSQTSSNSVLGATGGATLAVTLTKILSFIVLITCISLAVVFSKSNKSVVDGTVAAAGPVAAGPIAAGGVSLPTSGDTTPSKK